MKKIYSFLLITAFTLISLAAIAQPPPPGNNPSDNGNAVVGGAPLENGTFILLTLGVAYISRKLYLMWQTRRKEA
jgi:hypothetical protein